MKAYQITHCKHRAEDIYFDKKNAVKKLFTMDSKCLTGKEKINLIRRGKVTLKAEKDIDYDGYESTLITYWDFSKYCWASFIKPEGKKKLELLSIQFQDVIDQIILGDSIQAKQILVNWENKV